MARKKTVKQLEEDTQKAKERYDNLLAELSEKKAKIAKQRLHQIDEVWGYSTKIVDMSDDEFNTFVNYQKAQITKLNKLTDLIFPSNETASLLAMNMSDFDELLTNLGRIFDYYRSQTGSQQNNN